MFERDCHDRVHVSTLAKQVNGNDGFCFFGNERFYVCRIDVERSGFDVCKYRDSAESIDSAGGCEESEGRADDFIARFDPNRHQSQHQSVAS